MLLPQTYVVHLNPHKNGPFNACTSVSWLASTSKFAMILKFYQIIIPYGLCDHFSLVCIHVWRKCMLTIEMSTEVYFEHTVVH